MSLTFSRGHYNKHAAWKRLFVFEYPVTYKKNFKIHINFIEINVNVCLLCAPHVMTSIILHTRRPNVHKVSVTNLVFMFRPTFIFRILRS